MKVIIMKTMILTATILGMSLSFAACSDDNAPVITDKNLSETTTFLKSTEPSNYTTYYKPYVGYVGDPMPYFDPISREFRILYLQDDRDGNSTIYHPIHELATKDAASYTSFREAIPCGPATSDDPAIGTGSTVYDAASKTYYTFYTGHKGTEPREVILLATSPDCKSWSKDPSFRLPAPVEAGYDKNEFRDPYVFYDEDAQLYRMLVSALKSGDGYIIEFTSTNLHDWNLQPQPFFTNIWGRFYECPDVFKMGNYWYMVYSSQGTKGEPAVVQYFYASTLEALKQIAVEPNGGFPASVPHEGWLDGVGFYAGKTASDGQNRYLWGWCPTREGQRTTGTKNWAGALVAHKLIQNQDGTLSLDVPQAISAKYTQSVALTEKAKVGEVTSTASSYTLKANSFVRFARLGNQNKIKMTVTIPEGTESVFGLSFVDCSDKEEKARIFVEDKYSFLKLKEVKVNEKTGEWNDANPITERAITPAADNVYHIEAYTEQSVCVVYINGEYAFTNRIYDLAKNPWAIFCSDGEVTVTDIQLSNY